MFEEVKEVFLSVNKPGIDSKWTKVDFASILSPCTVDEFFNNLVKDGDITVSHEQAGEKHTIPMFGVTLLKEKGIELICDNLKNELKKSLYPLRHTPSAVLFTKQQILWSRIIHAHKCFYSVAKLKKALEKLSEDGHAARRQEKQTSDAKCDSKNSNDVLVETGVKTSLDLVFSLMRQTWAQLSWQKQLHQFISASSGNG